MMVGDTDIYSDNSNYKCIMSEKILNHKDVVRVPYGTDQLFSLVLDFEDSGQPPIVGEPLPPALDLRQAEGLRITLSSECGDVYSDLPYRISEQDGRHNILIVELPYERQHLGLWWCNIAFDLPNADYADGKWHHTRHFPLCYVAGAETAGSVRPRPQPQHTLLLSRATGAVRPFVVPDLDTNLFVYSRLAMGRINYSNIEQAFGYVHDPTFYQIAPGEVLRFTEIGIFKGWESDHTNVLKGWMELHPAANVTFYDELRIPFSQVEYLRKSEQGAAGDNKEYRRVGSELIVAPRRAMYYRYDAIWSCSALVLQRVDPRTPAPRPTTFTPSPEDVRAAYPFREVIPSPVK